MVMSTQILDEASRLMEYILVDKISIYNAGDPVTVGFEVTRQLTPASANVPAVVQTTVLNNAEESRTVNVYSIKVARHTELSAGQVITVDTCYSEPSLVGLKLLIDKVSESGLSTIRKAVASDFNLVNQEGKEGL